tara:strand:+ start:38497 stop:38646 length:150 start_codon:yes stop_codon:yes gene_type:complete
MQRLMLSCPLTTKIDKNIIFKILYFNYLKIVVLLKNIIYIQIVVHLFDD